jgi:hypothetical protein
MSDGAKFLFALSLCVTLPFIAGYLVQRIGGLQKLHKLYKLIWGE